MAQESIATILKMAIRSEEEAHAFYLEVAGRVKDAAIRQTFNQLAADELGHKQFLLGCKKDPSLLDKLPAVPDYKVAEATAEPVLSVDLKPAEAIALAMKKEARAAADYRRLAAASTVPDYRRAFEGLAAMELGHKAKLEAAFVDIGYPEVF